MIKKGMHCNKPASNWEEAFPGGNGKTAVLVMGNPVDERIIINHEQLFLPMHGRIKMPEMAQFLPAIRQLIQDKKPGEAAKLFVEKSTAQGVPGFGPDYFHPAFDIRISMPGEQNVSDYLQTLDFSTGEITTSWKNGDTKIERKVFVSRPDDAIVTSIKVLSDSASDCHIWLYESGQDTQEERRILQEHLQDTEISTMVDQLSFVCHYRNAGGFCGYAKVISNNGNVAVSDGKIITSATEILIIAGVSPNLNLRKLQEKINNLPCSYGALYSRHVAKHKPLFERVKFSLNSKENEQYSNEELIKQGKQNGMSPALAERMHDYGRYLLICSAGKIPPNAQGIWNGTWKISNLVDYVTNIELEMATWPALPGGLPECLEGYFDFIESFLPDWRENAKKLYGCRGVLASSRSSNHGQLHHFSEGYPHEFWTAGAGWMAQTFYDYWQFTGDKEFLMSRVLPLMNEVALFYEDFLIDDSKGKLQFIPSVSPENNPGNSDSLVARNATMDIAIAKEIFTNLINICNSFNVEQENIPKWQQILNRLPDYQVNADGSIREWVAPEWEENYPHRHVSHLYPAFPGFEAEDNTFIANACKKAIDMRLENGLLRRCGWSLGHTVNTAARLKDGDLVYKFLSEIATYFVHSNLFTLLDSTQGMFQVDANLGFTAAVMEALVFSLPGRVELLPALPPQWSMGSIDGVCSRGNVKVKHLAWNVKKRKGSATLLSPINQKVELKTAGKYHGLIELKSNQEYEFSFTL